ncbi:hypothetical protein XH99_02830 [Bradyrhizobium nanningense]|uniref:Uncharacterized protein n=1 Tax=Bradyrhizobium nanningense TaxID=1325118 RepID=A0A4Q0SFE0_9BRAD|nr:hypothetical protein XH84_30975 [Bradyrhizobium nanningense]RXH37109.1 hypothetical protein XH99_02830 [Bradyrhizobium nanningense]
MASIRQIKANRANAKRSTGPKTAGGKARSGQNALRHGLARSAIGDPAEAANFAAAIASGLGHQVTSASAMALARSKLALLRLRRLRQDMLAALLTGPIPVDLKRLKALERYERVALVQQRRALRLLRLERRWCGHLASFWKIGRVAP